MDSKDAILVKHIGEKKKRVKKENLNEEEKAEEIDPKGEALGQTQETARTLKTDRNLISPKKVNPERTLSDIEA